MSKRTLTRRPFRVFGYIACCVALAGCQGARIVAPRELPPEVIFVVENKSSFPNIGEDTFEDADAPRLSDDPAALSGCWGRVVIPPSNGASVGLLEWFYVEVFDVENGSYRGWFFSRLGFLGFGLITTLNGVEGRFSVVENDGVRLEILREMTTIPTGDLDVFEFPDPVVLDLRIGAITQERVSIHYGPGGATTVGIPPRNTDVVYQRFECPEESDGG